MATNDKGALTYQAMMECSGMTDTNTMRVRQALDRLHNAVSQMDAKQLKLFKNTTLGRFCIASASLYGQAQDGLRGNFDT